MSFKMSGFPLSLVASLGLTVSGCLNQEEQTPVAPEANQPGREASGLTPTEKSTLYPVLSEVTQGTSKVTFLDAGNGEIVMTQLFDAGRIPPVGPSMDGLTYAEIHARLAPEKPVPAALALDTFRIAYGQDVKPDQAFSHSQESTPLAKKSGVWDLWFQQTYCSGADQCLLNRTPGPTDWAQASNVHYSFFYVMVYQGNQINLRVLVGGQTKYTATVLYGQVWYVTSKSPTDFWGNLLGRTHRLEISDGSGDGWHIAADYI